MLAVLLCINYMRFCVNNAIFIGCIVATALLFLYAFIPVKQIRELYATYFKNKYLVVSIFCMCSVAANMIYCAYFIKFGINVIICFILIAVMFFTQQTMSMRLSLVNIIDDIIAENNLEEKDIIETLLYTPGPLYIHNG